MQYLAMLLGQEPARNTARLNQGAVVLLQITDFSDGPDGSWVGDQVQQESDSPVARDFACYGSAVALPRMRIGATV
jgi:hypothetical protein